MLEELRWTKMLDPCLTPGHISRLERRVPGARIWLKHWCLEDGARGTRTPDLLGAIQGLVPSAEEFPDGYSEQSA